MARSRSAAMLVLASVVAMAGCFERDPVGTAPAAVGQVELTPASGAVQLGDSLQLTARALSSAGQALAGRTITWSTNNPSILRVSSTGVVVGLAPGQATVTASTGGRSATAPVEVHPWNVSAAVVVIDSTRLRLIGDTGERAAGRYRFQVISSPAQQLNAGQTMVGAEKGGFLRRVLSVTSEGSDLVVDTEPAALAAVIRAGGFSTTVDLLSGAGPLSALSARSTSTDLSGRVLWGEGRFDSMVAGMTADAGAFDLSDIDVCAMLLDAGGTVCPAGLEVLRFTGGTLAFDPEFSVEAAFANSRLTRFRGVLTGPLTVDVGLEASASTPLVRFEARPTLFTFVRPFITYIGPVPVVGHVQLAVDARLVIAQSASGGVETGLQSQSVVQVGAEWAGSWTTIDGSTGSFSPRQPELAEGTLSRDTDLIATVALVPRAQLVVYGVAGPFAEVRPFNEVTVSRHASCAMTASTGLDAAIGFALPFLDATVGTLNRVWDPAVEGSSHEWPCPVGGIEVSVSTTGEDIDPDGFTVVLDGRSAGTVSSNGQLTLGLVEPGNRIVRLEDVAPNCTVHDGPERAATVMLDETTPVAFTVSCTSITGINVRVTSAGVPATDSDWQLTLNGDVTRMVRAPAEESFTLAAGTYALELHALPHNCEVQGANPRSVTVPARTTVDVTLHVECATGDLRVSVNTAAGNPWPVTAYTVTVDGRTLEVGVDGSVNFTDLPAGQVEVRLDGVPAHCTVMGPSTQTVAAPGTAAFEVVCEPPAICAAPPAVTMLEDIRHHPGQGGTWSAEILAAQWNLMRATANSTAPPMAGDRLTGPEVGISLGGSDYIQLLPLDTTRVGESVTLYIEVSGEIKVNGNGDDIDAHSILRFHGLSGGFFEERRYTIRDGTMTGAPGTFPASAVVMVGARLGEWSELQSELYINVGPGSNGSVSNATAELRVNRLVEARDGAGNPVPIASTCTASDTAY